MLHPIPAPAPQPARRPRAFLYCRKSSESSEAQKYSIPAQLNEMRQRAAELGIEIVRTFTESQSARKPGRPVFDEMMNAIYDGAVEILLCWQPDRLSRNGKDAGVITFALEEGYLQQIVTHDKAYTRDGMNRMVLMFEFGASRIASDDIIEKTQRGVRAKVERGEAPGAPPWGYLNAKESKKHGIIVPDERAWPYVRQVWDMALAGYTLKQIADATKDFPSEALGKKGFAGKPLSVSGLQQILTNPFYCGTFRWGGALHPGIHRAMVTRSEFDRVLAILSRRLKNGPRTKRKMVGLPGTFFCGHCRRRLSPYEKLKAGRRYVYYKCSRRGCPQRPISEPRLMEQLRPMLARTALRPEERDACIALLRERNAQELQIRQRRALDAELEIRKLAEKRARALDLFTEGKILERDYELQIARIAEQEHQMEAARGNATTDHASWFELAEMFIRGLTDADKTFEALPEAARGRFLRSIEFEPEVHERKLRLDANCEPLILLNRSRHPVGQALADAVRTHFLMRA